MGHGGWCLWGYCVCVFSHVPLLCMFAFNRKFANKAPSCHNWWQWKNKDVKSNVVYVYDQISCTQSRNTFLNTFPHALTHLLVFSFRDVTNSKVDVSLSAWVVRTMYCRKNKKNQNPRIEFENKANIVKESCSNRLRKWHDVWCRILTSCPRLWTILKLSWLCTHLTKQ